MGLAAYVQPPQTRRWGLRVAVTAGVLLLFALGAGAPAWGAGAKGPHRIIFDATATPSWWYLYHGPGFSYDVATDVAMTKGGVAYVAGAVGTGAGTDASLTKLVDGVAAWPEPKTYDGPYHSVDVTSDIALGPGNTVYTAGMSVGANGLFDILLVKWSSAGAVQWARRYDGPARAHDQATALAVDSAGNVTVAGVTMSGMSSDWIVVSWSASGARRWTSSYTGGGLHQVMPRDLVVAPDRSVYASGASSVGADTTAMTVRYSAAGRTLWKKTYAGPAGLGAVTLAAAVRPGGGVYVCGATASAGTGSDGLVMSYTPSGARDVFALDTGPGGASEQQFNDLAVTSTDQVVAVGSSAVGANEDCHLATYTTAGTIAGQVTIPGTWQDELVAVATDTFGGFYVTGTVHTAANKTAVFAARGSVLTGGGGWWSVWAPAFVSEDNEASAVAVRGSTACVVGRFSEGAAQGVDQLVLGYVY